MATVNITKLNNYIPGQDVPDITDNIDIDRLGIDKTMITVNYGVSPAQVTILKGALIEANGDTYLETTDNTFAMANASHNYLTFNGTSYSSAASIGTFDITKQGYYSGSARTLKYYIDQANSTHNILIDILYPDLTLLSTKLDKIKIGLSGDTNFTGSPGAVIPLDTPYLDFNSAWDTVNYNYTAPETGYYYMSIHGDIGSGLSATLGILIDIYKNSVSICQGIWNKVSSGSSGINQDAFSIGTLDYLEKGDIIELHGTGDPSIYMKAGEQYFYFLLYRYL